LLIEEALTSFQVPHRPGMKLDAHKLEEAYYYVDS